MGNALACIPTWRFLIFFLNTLVTHWNFYCMFGNFTDESLLLFSLEWTVYTGSAFKGLHNGSAVKTDMFRRGDREQDVSMHTEQWWAPSKIADNVLTVRCWTLQHCSCLHSWETLQWQHDELTFMKESHCKTGGEIRWDGRELGEQDGKSQCLLNCAIKQNKQKCSCYAWISKFMCIKIDSCF